MTAHENAVQHISIVGTGYVGLSTAVCFASRGYDVIASTHNEDKVRIINAKRAPFYEPGLDEAVRTGIESGHLIAEIDRSEAVRDFGLFMNPEFLQQGSAIRNTLYPDRVIIGEYDKRSGQQLADLLADFYGPGTPLLRMSLESAEIVKYASNTF